MLGRRLVFGLLTFASFSVFADGDAVEAPVAQAQQAASNIMPMNDVPAQQYVQRNTAPDGGEQDLSLLLNKVSKLEQEMQQLRGTLEVQAHDLKLLNEQQQAFYKDLDIRLSKLTKSPSKDDALSASPQENTEQGAKQDSDPKNLNNGEKAAVNGKDGERSYNAAYSLIKQKQYTQAISAMEAFVIAYPSSEYLSNANYWLGELYLMQGNSEQALQYFNTVVSQFPNSNKAAGALLKIGFAHYDKGQWQEARKALKKVTALYPDTALSRLAANRLQRMQQQGL